MFSKLFLAAALTLALVVPAEAGGRVGFVGGRGFIGGRNFIGGGIGFRDNVRVESFRTGLGGRAVIVEPFVVVADNLTDFSQNAL